MKISKLLSAIASSALIAGSFTAMPVAASAATAAPSLYNMNIANQSSQGDAREFVTAGGVTYFSVNTLNKGRSIWSLAATAGATPQLVADVAEGSVYGNPMGISVQGNFLFFWDDATSAYDGVAPYVVHLTTKVVTELVASDGGALRSDLWPAPKFVSNGSKVFFYSNTNRDGDNRLRSWNLSATDGKTEIVDELNFNPNSISIVDGTIWLTSDNSNWGVCDNGIKTFDPASSTWGSVVDSNSTPLTCVGYSGQFDYNGNQVSIVSRRLSNVYEYYSVNAAGVATRLGSWSAVNGGSFINMGSELYVRIEPNWGDNYVFNKVSSVDGSLESQNAIMFPGATSVRLTSMAYTGGKLFFAGNLNRIGKEQLYMWDGTNAAVQIGNYEPLGRSEYFAEFVAAGGWSRNESVGVVGNSAIINLALDDAISYEPYLLNPDGTISLVKNFNTGSEGSSPNLDCTTSAANSDLLSANLPLLNTSWGKDVMVEAKSDGTNLQYSVIDPGADVRNVCGFVSIGTDTYFAGESEADGDGLYKMTANRTITRLGNLSNSVRMATIVNNKYYYWSDSDSDLWVYDLATNTDSQLTGANGSIISSDSINGMWFFGNYVVFKADLDSSGQEKPFSVDMSAATYTEVAIISDANATDDNPGDVVLFNGMVYYLDEIDSDTGPKLFKAPLAGGNATLVADLSDDAGYSNQMRVIGSDLYVSHENDVTNQVELMRFAGGTTKSMVTLPAGLEAECMAPSGSQLLIAGGTNGDVYSVNGSTVAAVGVTLNDYYSLCDAVVTPRGLYMYGSEYGYYGGPFDDELLYFGTLVPVAIERLGAAVNEGPAGVAGGIPAVDAVTPGAVTALTATVGSGVINLSWTAPTTGTTPRYLVTSTPAGAVCSITGTSAVCTGTAGVSYTFTVKAGNDAGASAGVRTAAVVAPGNSVTPPKVNPEDPSVSSVTESKTVKAAYGLVTFPDGSGFDVDAKGRIYAKIKSTYLTSTSGTIIVNYKVGSVNKVYTCKVKPFGSLKKLKKAPTKGIVSKSKQACQLPAAAVTVLKTKSVVVKATMSVKRYWATTVKAKTPAGKVLKVQARKMTVTMGKGAK